jgi:hypothetical protein
VHRIDDLKGALGVRPAMGELRRHDRPVRIGVGAMKVDAVQAGTARRLDCGADEKSGIAENDRKVRNVMPEPAVVHPGRDGKMRDDDREVNATRLGSGPDVEVQATQEVAQTFGGRT